MAHSKSLAIQTSEIPRGDIQGIESWEFHHQKWYEEPMVRPNTDDEHHHVMETVSSGLTVSGPGSQVSAQV